MKYDLTFHIIYGSIYNSEGEEDEPAAQRFVLPPVEAFISKWSSSGGSELGSSQSFINELCDILGVPKPAAPRSNIADNTYAFEAQVRFRKADGSTSIGRIDLYKEGCFVWESKQGSEKISKAERDNLIAGWRTGTAVRGTQSWDNAMWAARDQAEAYARGIAPHAGRPPFILVADIGNSVELFADFTNSGIYSPFPSSRENRIRLEDLRREEVRTLLNKIWTDPFSLDPAREREKVTLDIAAQLGNLAKSLEAAGHDPEEVSQFLMSCIFALFAEDSNLLPNGSFTNLLSFMADRPDDFLEAIKGLWADMNAGGHSKVLNQPVLEFKGPYGEAKPLRLTPEQMRLLHKAAEANWAAVEPSIFGTLLERALDPRDRHSLGAHYTPPAYVEKLVVPTIIEPLREEWTSVIVKALEHIDHGDQFSATWEIEEFHKKLSETIVLDPSCGSGNFLAVAQSMMKDIEGEVIKALRDLGQTDREISKRGYSVRPFQFKGIEVSPHAAAISELVLWISFFQKHKQQYGAAVPATPLLESYGRGNIQCRDAILAWDMTDTADEDLRYLNARRADPWPEDVDYIVGNPPFLGPSRMRKALGDTYVEALRKVYPEVPGNADYVLYWWHVAAEMTRAGQVKRFGYITTNSVRQKQGRQVLDYHMKADPPLKLAFAVPDHPWVDASASSIDTANVRIAMTVGTMEPHLPGTLSEVILERPGQDGDGFLLVNYDTRKGRINSNLTIGADVGAAKALRSNSLIAGAGITPNGKGFIVTPDEAKSLGLGTIPGLENHIKPYRNGRDIAAKSRNVMIIDLYGLTIEEVKRRFPAVYQHLVDNVKPGRDKAREETLKTKWWLLGRARGEFREAFNGLERYIVTPQTSRRRYFIFLNPEIIPDSKLVSVASADAYVLGVLSSRVHQEWILTAGGKLGTGNDPVYDKTTCFDKFPFPDATEDQKEQIRAIAEKIDAHRKERQAEHPKLTMTDMYAVLDDMKYGVHLNAKKEKISQQGDLTTLFQLHKELDAAVAEAYGWPVDLPTDELLVRLLELNHERAEQEENGKTLWLRPDFQAIRHGVEVTHLNDAPLNRFQLMLQRLEGMSAMVH